MSSARTADLTYVLPWAPTGQWSILPGALAATLGLLLAAVTPERPTTRRRAVGGRGAEGHLAAFEALIGAILVALEALGMWGRRLTVLTADGCSPTPQGEPASRPHGGCLFVTDGSARTAKSSSARRAAAPAVRPIFAEARREGRHAVTKIC